MIRQKNDVATKITVLIIAIFLWIYVMDKENPEQTNRIRNIPVSFTNQAYLERNGLVIVEPESASINIDVTGKKSDLSNLDRSDIIAIVDLGGYNEGQVKVPIRMELANQSTALRITSWEPRDIMFTFDKVISKEMPISIETTGELPANYVLGDIVTRQQSVLLTGPRTAINSVQRAVAYVDVSNKTSLFNVSVPMAIVDHNGENVIEVSYEPRLVEATIPVYRTKEVPIEINLENSLPEGLILKDINISPATVIVRGNENIQDITAIETEPIDVQSLIGQTSMEVDLQLPEGVHLLDESKIFVISYEIDNIVTKEFALSLENTTILNLDEGLRLSDDYKDNQVVISLQGEQSFLDQLQNTNIGTSIDLQGITQGRHDVNIIVDRINNIDINTMEGIAVESINPQRITVNVHSDIE